MKHFTSAVVLLFVICVVLSGCGSDTRNERGVFTVGESTCYKIDFQGKDIEDYFTPTDPSGKVSVSGGSIAQYSAVEEGGWIAYCGEWLMYIPATVDQTTVQTLCGNFYKINPDDYLTLNKAKTYLPWLEVE